MKSTALNPSFEVDISNLLTPTSVNAVFQSINTLTSGQVLKVTACSQNTVVAVVSFCKNSGNTLLQKDNIDNEITLFIKKN
jgi:TusA-related sulfurtransferase